MRLLIIFGDNKTESSRGLHGANRNKAHIERYGARRGLLTTKKEPFNFESSLTYKSKKFGIRNGTMRIYIVAPQPRAGAVNI